MAYKKIMTVESFLKILKSVQRDYKTVYVYGGIGQIVTNSLLAAKAKQYPSFYTLNRMAILKKFVGKGYYGFDCVNVIKSILWGWHGDKNHVYGGAIYASNTVPDVSADGFISLCTGVSSSFKNIQIGEAVWLPGHIGIYIGNGLVIECSPRWSNNVQITCCANVKSVSGYNKRTWSKHGKIPWLIYGSSQISSVKYFPACDKNEVSIVNALQKVGYDSSMSSRKKIAYKNGISKYSGTYSQNSQLLVKMKQGKLIKP